MRKTIIIFLFPSLLWASQGVFKTDRNCVAYKTTKGMFWVGESDIIGRNHKVSVMLIKKLNKIMFKVRAPLNSFKSGNSTRDKAVIEILHGDKYPDMVFETEAMSKGKWQKLSKKKTFVLSGLLKIAGKNRSIKFMVKSKHGTMQGKLVTKFSNLGLKPPKAGPGGMIADTKDYIELHFQFRFRDIKHIEMLQLSL